MGRVGGEGEEGGVGQVWGGKGGGVDVLGGEGGVGGLGSFWREGKVRRERFVLPCVEGWMGWVAAVVVVVGG